MYYNETSKTITSEMNRLCVEVESYSEPTVSVNKCSGCHNHSWSRDEKLSNLKHFELLGSLLNNIL